jgi:transposase
MSRRRVKGGDLAAVAARLAAARAEAVRSGVPVRVLSCYEAGFDGHWLHRWLGSQGVVSHEVDLSSIEVNRRARRAKTDRLDLARIKRLSLAHLAASRRPARWCMCRAPNAARSRRGDTPSERHCDGNGGDRAARERPDATGVSRVVEGDSPEMNLE